MLIDRSQAPRSLRDQTPVALVRAVLLAYARRGIAPNAALKAAQIAPSVLADDHGYVTAQQFGRLGAAAMRELDDEALGWFSRRLPWGSYGMLARAVISAPNLGVALQRWSRYHGFLTQDVALRLTQDDEQAELTIEEHRNFGELREFALLTLLRNANGFACWLIDSQIRLSAVEFPFTAPPHADLYARVFAGPTRFNASRTKLRFDAAYLCAPLRRDSKALDQLLKNAVPLLVWPWRRDRLLAPRVRSVLTTENHNHDTAEDLAAELFVSVRTLHRKLRAEGVSLQQIKDQVRCARACDLLMHSTLPIGRIAAAVGFENEKSFSRAFRQWTGRTLKEYRSRAEQ